MKLEQLAKKYKFRCVYCKQKKPIEDLTRDHFIPTSKGGSGTYENVVLACKWCNTQKGDTNPYYYKYKLKHGL